MASACNRSTQTGCQKLLKSNWLSFVFVFFPLWVDWNKFYENDDCLMLLFLLCFSLSHVSLDLMDNCISAATLAVEPGLLFYRAICAPVCYFFFCSCSSTNTNLSFVVWCVCPIPCFLRKIIREKEREIFWVYFFFRSPLEKRRKKKGGLYIMVC